MYQLKSCKTSFCSLSSGTIVSRSREGGSHLGWLNKVDGGDFLRLEEAVTCGGTLPRVGLPNDTESRGQSMRKSR